MAAMSHLENVPIRKEHVLQRLVMPTFLYPECPGDY